MAGESPDRSKQRESSEHPTSGSSGPVPEARSEAQPAKPAEERPARGKLDPRLAVARETAPPSSPEAPRTGGGADTATKEFVVRDAAAEDADGAERAEDAPRSEGTGGGTRDGRLREAVAAWVASADGEPGKSPEKAEEGAQGAPGAPEATRGGPDDDTGEAGPDRGDAAEDSDDAADDDPAGDADGATSGEAAETEEPDAEPKDAAPADARPGGDAATGDAKPAPRDAEDEDTSGPDDSDADDDSRPSDGKSGAPRVDRATAAFKAVRPPVDQPTTMLKAGDAAAEPEDRPKAGPAPQAEAAHPDTPRTPGTGTGDAGRASRFVALRPLDEPRAEADATRAIPQLGPERTTQQPLPPKPPLDLLAELTNTPPPPETPLRTLARRVKIWTPLVLLLVIVFAVVQSVRALPQPTLDLTAQESYTFDGGKVDIPWPADGQAALDVQGIGSFGSSGSQKPVPIASVAKVMTAYLILRDHPVKSGSTGPDIKIDQAAEDQSDAGQESTVPVTAGDAISEREALESILIASANNVARLLARWDAGSEKAFVAKMNAAAEKLGMADTTYTDPSGLNNTTVSTAVDQVKLAKAAMKKPVFREVAAMMSYVDYKGVKHNNWNQLVGFNDVVGIKTGTTTSALGNLVFAAKKEVGGETRTVVGAVVRQPAGGSDNTILQGALSAGDRLIRAAQDALESATILKKGTVVGFVDNGLGGRTPVAVTRDVKAVGWAGLSVKLTFAGADLPQTAKAGTKVGTLTVGDGTSSAVKIPVALREDLVEPGFGDKLTRIL
ncbi:D-alanyl-D-alanine carboxypeptidase [Streptomyces sp. NPDC005925]|uniref:D-alanyl-D-alanine carboxypeptidase n=1 Tax=Streptomyces sp. NPDC005925 TaxID=3157172 RepID=UPI0033FD15A5